MNALTAQEEAIRAPERVSLRKTCEEAVAALDEAMARKSPGPVVEETDVAEAKLAALRDGLIDRLRANPPGRARRSLQSALERANAALSLIMGVEYPIEGILKDHLKEARSTIKPLLRRSVLDVH